MRWPLLATMILAACGPIEPDERAPLRRPDRALFSEEAGPLLGKRCGDLGCHGDAARPYALYAEGRRRLPPLTTYSKEALLPAEEAANYVATIGFVDDDDPLRTTLLRKALGEGGAEAHGGGAVFEAQSDPECRAIVSWLRTEGS